MRADAARNRERILDAACGVFAQRGPDVPLEEVAVEAGVGIATLYRRFASREELLAAVAARQTELYERVLAEALADRDAWEGFCHFIRRVSEIQAEHPGMAEALTAPCPGPLHDGYLELIRRAQLSGRLRADYAPEDLPMLLMANAGVVRATAQAAPKTWRRLVEYFLQALSCPQRKALPAPPTAKQMTRVLQQKQGAP